MAYTHTFRYNTGDYWYEEHTPPTIAAVSCDESSLTFIDLTEESAALIQPTLAHISASNPPVATSLVNPKALDTTGLRTMVYPVSITLDDDTFHHFTGLPVEVVVDMNVNSTTTINMQSYKYDVDVGAFLVDAATFILPTYRNNYYSSRCVMMLCGIMRDTVRGLLTIKISVEAAHMNMPDNVGDGIFFNFSVDVRVNTILATLYRARDFQLPARSEDSDNWEIV